MSTALTLVDVKKNIVRMSAAGELPLPSNVSVEAFQNAASVAITDNPNILKCDQTSLFKSIRRIAAMGLVPDGHEAALVPYGNTCQAIPMVTGLIKRARQSGEISTIWAEVVYQGEGFVVDVDGGVRTWKHDYDPFQRGGEIVGAYAVAKMRDGGVEFEPMSRKDIDKLRNISKAKGGPAWTQWFEEMAKKSAIRRLCKRLPMSSDIRRSIVESDEATIGMKDITPKQTLQEKLDAKKKAAEPKPEPILGEIVEPDPSKGTKDSPRWKEGAKAAQGKSGFNDNPYVGKEADDWAGGWSSVMDADTVNPADEGVDNH